MSRERSRKLTLSDAMTLVAATAVGLAMARAYDPSFSSARQARFLKQGWGAPACLTVPWAFGLILLQVRGSRHRLRVLLRRPGMAACFALALAVAVAALMNLVHHVAHSRGDPARVADHLFNYIWNSAANLVPWAVVGAWVTLWRLGPRRPANDWVERAGRALGLYWFLYPVLELAAPIIVHVFPVLD